MLTQPIEEYAFIARDAPGPQLVLQAGRQKVR